MENHVYFLVWSSLAVAHAVEAPSDICVPEADEPLGTNW